MRYSSRIPPRLLYKTVNGHPEEKFPQGLVDMMENVRAAGISNATIMKCTMCTLSAALGHNKLLRHLLEELNKSDRECMLDLVSVICDSAARFGRLDIIKWIHQRFLTIDAIVIAQAALMGDQKILEWMDTGLILRRDLIHYWPKGLIQYQHLDLLDWGRDRGYITRVGFMSKYISHMNPAVFDWYVRNYGRPKDATMDRIRSRVAYSFIQDLLLHLNDPEYPYLVKDILQRLLHNSHNILSFGADESSPMDVGVLQHIAIKWEGCIHDVIENYYHSWARPRVIEAILHLLVNIGMPITCARHSTSTSNIHEAIVAQMKSGDNPTMVQLVSAAIPQANDAIDSSGEPQIVDQKVANTKNDDQKVEAAQSDQKVEAAQPNMPIPQINDFFALPEYRKRVETEDITNYDPIPLFATNEELIAIINASLNEREHIHTFRQNIICATGDELDDYSDSDANGTRTKTSRIKTTRVRGYHLGRF